jgi:hypothetical protein
MAVCAIRQKNRKNFMKIANLSLIAICYLYVQCSFGQTNIESPDARYFRELYDTTTWGMATNGIQFGVRLSAIGPSTADKFKIDTFLNDTNSTDIYGLWELPPGYRFEKITLKTKAGEEIKKTSKGNALCKTPLWYLSDGRTVVLNPKFLEDFDELFDPRDCFKIKKAGSYILTVKARLYAMKSYNEFVKLDIPEASIEVVFTENDLEQ